MEWYTGSCAWLAVESGTRDVDAGKNRPMCADTPTMRERERNEWLGEIWRFKGVAVVNGPISWCVCREQKTNLVSTQGFCVRDSCAFSFQQTNVDVHVYGDKTGG